MNLFTKLQKGSPSRDKFKHLHKHMMPSRAWALDSDLVLVEKYPIPFKVALLDFKLVGDGLSFTEAIAYKQDIDAPMPYTTPVYIIEADRNFRDDDVHPDEHRFKILRLIDCDYRPDPPTHQYELIGDGLTWEHLERWEMQLRTTRQAEVAAWLRAQRESAA